MRAGGSIGCIIECPADSEVAVVVVYVTQIGVIADGLPELPRDIENPNQIDLERVDLLIKMVAELSATIAV